MAQGFLFTCNTCAHSIEAWDDGNPLQLADLYMTGEGVPKDIDEAIRLTRLAAKQGEPSAQEMIRKLNKLNET